MSIERKCGSGRKKGFADQNKARKIIRIFRKHPKMSERKVAQKFGFCENTLKCINFIHKIIQILFTLMEI